MRDPELAYRRVAVRQREVIGRPRVREERRIEIEADTKILRPVDPPGEVFRANRTTIDAAPAELAVARVQAEPVTAGDEGQRLHRVSAELVGRARLPGIVAGRGDAPAQPGCAGLEAYDVIALPAVERDRNRREACQGRVGVHTELTISSGRDAVRRIQAPRHQRSFSRAQGQTIQMVLDHRPHPRLLVSGNIHRPSPIRRIETATAWLSL